MIVERMETSPLWQCSIQLAEENWATQPSPYTKNGETFTALYGAPPKRLTQNSSCR